MGGGGVASGGRPNQTAYFVALGTILFLLLLLCCYFCYYFVTKVKELSQQELSSITPATSQQRRPASYPVQPVIRDSATAMAALCRQLPPAGVAGAGAGGGGGKGDTVFPAATSPTALQTDTGCGPPPTASPTAPTALYPNLRDKIPPTSAAVAIELGAVS